MNYFPANIDIKIFVGTNKEWGQYRGSEKYVIARMGNCVFADMSNTKEVLFQNIVSRIKMPEPGDKPILFRFPETALVYPDLQSMFVAALIAKVGDAPVSIMIQSMSPIIMRDFPSIITPSGAGKSKTLGMPPFFGFKTGGLTDMFFSKYGRDKVRKVFQFSYDDREPTEGEAAIARLLIDEMGDEIIARHLEKLISVPV